MVGGDESRGGVGRPAGHPTGDGDVLVDPDREGLLDAGTLGHEPGRPDGEVVAVGRDERGVGAGGHDVPVVPPRHGDLVVEGHGLEDGREVVVAVGPTRAHPELEVDLRRAHAR